MEKYDAIVIGGGLAGLTSAIELSRAGRSVLVLEKAGKTGGRASTLNKGGELFNMGGHALYIGGEAERWFGERGLKLSGSKPVTKGLAIWNGGLAPLPGDPMSLAASKLLSWSGKAKLLSVLLKMARANYEALSRTSLREWAEAEIGDPMVRHVFYALCRTATYTQDPDLLSAGPALRQACRSLKAGVKYLDGGWQTIVDQLREMAVRLGAEIRTGTSIREVEHEYGRVIGVRCADGETIRADAVVSTAPPAASFGMVKGAEETVLRRWKEEARPAVVASMDLALRKLPVQGRHFAMGLDTPVFFADHSRAARLSDNGSVIVHLTKYNGPGQSDGKSDEKLLEETMSLLHPEWEREIVAKRYMPNIAVAHDYPHLGRTADKVGPEVPEIRGLYVAGDWASHGEWLADAAVASGLRAAKAAARESRAISEKVGS